MIRYFLSKKATSLPLPFRYKQLSFKPLFYTPQATSAFMLNMFAKFCPPLTAISFIFIRFIFEQSIEIVFVFHTLKASPLFDSLCKIYASLWHFIFSLYFQRQNKSSHKARIIRFSYLEFLVEICELIADALNWAHNVWINSKWKIALNLTHTQKHTRTQNDGTTYCWPPTESVDWISIHWTKFSWPLICSWRTFFYARSVSERVY